MKTKKRIKIKKNKIFSNKDYNSNDGMVTYTWGPALWHSLHCMSFNYPVRPSESDKKNYKAFILNLQNVLPCGLCRENLKKNLKNLPLLDKHMKDRNSFSRYIYQLHEFVNKMLGKKSGLSYCDVRERYEHFRSRCTHNETVKHKPKKESGCTEPLYGKKSKCIIKIVPIEEKCETFQIDKACVKTRQET